MSKTIQEYRAALGMTVAELLKATGWSQSTYDRISKGQRQLTKLEHLALDSMPRKRGRKKGSGKL